jgi:RecQ family ATP-dependent DNA helicase
MSQLAVREPPDRFPTVPKGIDDKLRAVLQKYWGFDQLRPLQGEAITAALEGRDSLVVMPTGGGKSLCYQVPAAVAGRTDIVVSPLISLMKDQVDALKACGYPAAALHSGLTETEKSNVIREMVAGRLRLVFVAPERLLTPAFFAAARRLDVRAFHIDEAHCISQWGHDFRPEYRRLTELRRSFPEASIHAYTATATPRVRSDIAVQLGLKRPAELVGIFDRPNLNYQIVGRDDPGSQMLGILARHQSEATIIYCISRKETEETSAFLRSKGVKAAAYHAGMTPSERTRTQEAFAAEGVDVVVATVAFGMGIDRSNVRCVVHAAMPKSVEHYQQETGRAGRDGLEAECIMLYSRSDFRRWSFIMDQSGALAETLEAQKALMRDMRNLVESPVCRHAALSRYFGQKYEVPDCGACDICVPMASPAGERDGGAGSDNWRGVDRDLFDRLRGLRKIIAGERAAPAYIIFSDATLRDLARSRPLSLGEMRQVKGIGERKLKDLGQRFVQEVRAHCRERGIAPAGRQATLSDAAPRPIGAPSPSVNLTKRQAFDLFREGKTVAEVAAAIGRAPGTIAEYLGDYLQDERPNDISAWVPEERYGRIRAAAHEAGIDRLKPIFEALNGEVPYDDIRIVVGHMRALNTEGRA